MTKPLHKVFTLEEYFDLEYQAPTRHEFINGKIIAMPYASENHELIVSNICRHLGNALEIKSLGCRVYPSNRMLFAEACDDIYYPDAMVVCGKSEFKVHRGKMEATVNPTSVFEILSDSTQNKDKKIKGPCYRQIPSLQSYILIDQHLAHVEIYQKDKENGRWYSEILTKEADLLRVAGAEISLKQIYQHVDFPELEEENEIA